MSGSVNFTQWSPSFSDSSSAIGDEDDAEILQLQNAVSSIGNEEFLSSERDLLSVRTSLASRILSDDELRTPTGTPRSVTPLSPSCSPVNGQLSPQIVPIAQAVSKALKRRRDDDDEVQSTSLGMDPSPIRRGPPPLRRAKRACLRPEVASLEAVAASPETTSLETSPFITNAKNFRESFILLEGRYILNGFSLVSFGQGKCKDVYAYDIKDPSKSSLSNKKLSNTLVKFYSEKLIEESPRLVERNYPLHELQQYDKCVQQGVPVAKILNRETISNDGYFEVEMIPCKIKLQKKWMENPSFSLEKLNQAEINILTQVRAFFTFVVRYNLEPENDPSYFPLALDLYPKNLRMKNDGTVVLIDFLETDEEDENPLVQIKEGLKSWVGCNKNIYDFMVQGIRQSHPDSVEMWGLSQFEKQK